MKLHGIIWWFLFVSTLTGCGLVNSGIAYFQSTENFIKLGYGGSIYYEYGSKDHAVLVDTLLSDAVATVERKQYKPFKEKIAIYICASKESFSKYSGAPKMARGAVFNEKLFISPRARETKTLKLILIHELSHLHFHQYVGNRRYVSNIPPWFQEGLAVEVSGGGGAEKVSYKVARDSMLKGHSFKPNDSGSLFFPKTAFWFGLKPQMFYRQSAMFVNYLHQNNPLEFKEFVIMLLNDAEFKVAFEKSFDQSIDNAWVKFIGTLKT
jgi:hypothetical protein